jgi:translation initiation factor IF-1
MIDSVHTFLSKHQDRPTHDLLAMAVEYGVLPEHATEADLSLHTPNPKGEGHFAAYDMIAEHLLQGTTLSTHEVQQMLGSVHMALHQDRRFFETKDGHWYLAHQQICNEPLVEMLSLMPGETVRLADLYLGLEGTPTFWKADERFHFDGALIALKPVSLPEPIDIEMGGEDEYEDLGFAGLFEVEPEIAHHADFADLSIASDFSILEDQGLNFCTDSEPEVVEPQQMMVQATELQIASPESKSKMQGLLAKLAGLQNLRTSLGANRS